jgi:hypothetical protein
MNASLQISICLVFRCCDHLVTENTQKNQVQERCNIWLSDHFPLTKRINPNSYLIFESTPFYQSSFQEKGETAKREFHRYLSNSTIEDILSDIRWIFNFPFGCFIVRPKMTILISESKCDTISGNHFCVSEKKRVTFDSMESERCRSWSHCSYVNSSTTQQNIECVFEIRERIKRGFTVSLTHCLVFMSQINTGFRLWQQKDPDTLFIVWLPLDFIFFLALFHSLDSDTVSIVIISLFLLRVVTAVLVERQGSWVYRRKDKSSKSPLIFIAENTSESPISCQSEEDSPCDSHLSWVPVSRRHFRSKREWDSRSYTQYFDKWATFKKILSSKPTFKLLCFYQL